ncbi:MAG: CotH kinase family protein [Planctomycetota bacterium]
MSLYDPSVLRTIFLYFENPDWEYELEDFKPTDVEVPCRMVVDGSEYSGVGVSFRGASSYAFVSAGMKRSLNLSVDCLDQEQRLYGYKTLNHLNCNDDPSMMSSFLYSQIAGAKMAVPKVNFVRVVINGQCWGIYANAQQFNKDFLQENYGTTKGARWKVTGNKRGDGGLRYFGEDTSEYRRHFEIKSKDEGDSWERLVSLCRVLNETPVASLHTEMSKVLDLEATLWFLAVDVALVNRDGYWTRASDYSIFEDENGRFHFVPHDMNEAFSGESGGNAAGRGNGKGANITKNGLRVSDPMADKLRSGRQKPSGGKKARGGGPGGATLDPLVGLDNSRTPLRSRLLQNPVLREKYTQYIQEIAAKHLSWEVIGPKIIAARKLIQEDVQADARKLMSYEKFLQATDPNAGSLKEFCETRSAYLRKY